MPAAYDNFDLWTYKDGVFSIRLDSCSAIYVFSLFHGSNSLFALDDSDLSRHKAKLAFLKDCTNYCGHFLRCRFNVDGTDHYI